MAFGFEEAKPWYFVFWFWYKLLETSKFDMKAGFHPGFLFSTTQLDVNGVNQEYFTTSRFFVGALTPGYSLSKDIRIGLYLQQARGYNSDLKNSSFLGLNCSFSNIRLGDKFHMMILPQVYYLKNDALKGAYLSSTITLTKSNFPISMSSLLNKKLKSDIPSDDFLWNLTLTYSY